MRVNAYAEFDKFIKLSILSYTNTNTINSNSNSNSNTETFNYSASSITISVINFMTNTYSITKLL